jgi:hypothetical protein
LFVLMVHAPAASALSGAADGSGSDEAVLASIAPAMTAEMAVLNLRVMFI